MILVEQFPGQPQNPHVLRCAWLNPVISIRYGGLRRLEWVRHPFAGTCYFPHDGKRLHRLLRAQLAADDFALPGRESGSVTLV